MSDHVSPPPNTERHCDVVVVGGSAAGLAAALQLGRQRWSVIVVDSGEPRNAPASHMHGYLSRDGLAPAELLRIGREEVRGYGVEILAGRVVGVTRGDADRFRVTLGGGHSILARRIVAATGLVDELPEIDGLADHWGQDVIHCPFCHGFEVRDRRIVQILTDPSGLHTTDLLRRLTDRLVVVVHGDVDLDEGDLAVLRSGGVEVRPGPVARIVTGSDGHVEAAELHDGDRVDADVIAVGPRFRVRAEPFRALGLRTMPHPSALGDYVETDATGVTSIPGLYAAGNITDPTQQVLQAAADGSRVGAMVSRSLAHDDLQFATRSSANQADWDARYGGEQIWSGRPNGSLVNQVNGMAPGRALDVGAGEGGDALWLAEQGWTVTAADISGLALDRIAAEAARRGLDIGCQQGDANALGVFEDGAFDLVCAQYASIPRTPDNRGVYNLIDAVGPGGTLLVVGHDLEPMRRSAEEGSHRLAFDPDAYLRTTDFEAVLVDSPNWEIEMHENQPRPPGAASASHHVDDVILRARRLP